MSVSFIILTVTALVIINSLGQVLLKRATINAVYKKHYLVSGYALFILSLVLVQFLLNYINFSTLALVISLNVIGVSFASVVLLREKMTTYMLYGTLMVALGGFLFINGDSLLSLL
ncbi:hypothetical protein BM527_16490 [Alteromonas sp. Mex14]|nr:hypothetical protein BM527_16490 [Alteromonas sp. Mex14]